MKQKQENPKIKKKKPEIESLYRNPGLIQKTQEKPDTSSLEKALETQIEHRKWKTKKLTQKNRAKPEERRGDQDGRETVAA